VIKICLRKDSAAFGAKNMPTDIRSIAKFLGARTLQVVTRHCCINDGCSYAWIGSVHPKDFDSNDVCLDCNSPKYIRKGGKVIPRRVFFYVRATSAIEALHRHPVFRAHWKKIDHSLNAYRISSDDMRLNVATQGEALAEMNGLYISMADVFHWHKSSTQSITSTPHSLLASLFPCLTVVVKKKEKIPYKRACEGYRVCGGYTVL